MQCLPSRVTFPHCTPHPADSWNLAISFLHRLQPDGVTLEYNPYSWNLVSLPLWVLGGCLSSWMGKGTAPLNHFHFPSRLPTCYTSVPSWSGLLLLR